MYKQCLFYIFLLIVSINYLTIHKLPKIVQILRKSEQKNKKWTNETGKRPKKPKNIGCISWIVERVIENTKEMLLTYLGVIYNLKNIF